MHRWLHNMTANNRLDRAAAWLYGRRRPGAKLYAEGWGESIAAIDARFEAMTAFDLPAPATPTWRPWQRRREIRWRDGVFPSPEADLPTATRTVFVRAVEPHDGRVRRAVVLLGAWAQEGEAGRGRVARRLARHGIASWLPESPFHGQRRVIDPRRPGRHRSGPPVRTVVEFCQMTRAHIIEGLALLDFLRSTVDPDAGVAGFSMGAAHAAAIAAVDPNGPPTVLSAAAYSSTVSFVDGALSPLIAWRALAEDLQRYRGGQATRQDAIDRMRELLGQVSLFRLGRPARPDRISLIAGEHDLYVDPRAVERLAETWGLDPVWRPHDHAGLWFFDRAFFADTILRRLGVDAEPRADIRQAL